MLTQFDIDELQQQIQSGNKPELYYVSKDDTVYTDDVYVSLEDVEDNDLSVSNVRPICVVN